MSMVGMLVVDGETEMVGRPLPQRLGARLRRQRSAHRHDPLAVKELRCRLQIAGAALMAGFQNVAGHRLGRPARIQARLSVFEKNTPGLQRFEFIDGLRRLAATLARQPRSRNPEVFPNAAIARRAGHADGIVVTGDPAAGAGRPLDHAVIKHHRDPRGNVGIQMFRASVPGPPAKAKMQTLTIVRDLRAHGNRSRTAFDRSRAEYPAGDDGRTDLVFFTAVTGLAARALAKSLRGAVILFGERPLPGRLTRIEQHHFALGHAAPVQRRGRTGEQREGDHDENARASTRNDDQHGDLPKSTTIRPGHANRRRPRSA